MDSLNLPPLSSQLTAKIEPRLMKDTYKKVHIYLFDFDIVLGKGSFSKVYKGINLNTNDQVAVKVIQMGSINTPKLKQLLLQQIDILMKIKHDNLIKCFEVLSSSKNTYIIMELCTHDLGSVCDYIRKNEDIEKKQFLEKQNHKFLHTLDTNTPSSLMGNTSTKQKFGKAGSKIPEVSSSCQSLSKSINSISSTKSVQFQQSSSDIAASSKNLSSTPLKQQKFYPYIKQIFSGLQYLSQQNIVHRDLKLSNIFLTPSLTCKIGDFGFATIIPKTKIQIKDTCCIGSPLYMSPQSYIDNVYSLKSDVWSFGVLIFEMIYGNPPLWNCPTHEILKAEIKRMIYLSKFDKLAKISDQMKEVLQGCLQVQVRKRFTISQLKQTRLFRRLFYQPLQSNVIVNTRTKQKIEQSSVQVLGRPGSYHKDSPSKNEDQLSPQFEYTNFSTIHNAKQNQKGINTLHFQNQSNINSKFMKTDQNFYDRKTEKTQTLKHNNSCMKFGLEMMNNNSFTDRGKSIDNSDGKNGKGIPSKFNDVGYNVAKQDDYSINRSSHYGNKPTSRQAPFELYEKTQRQTQIQTQRQTKYEPKQKALNDMKFKSTDLNGNIFKEMNKMNSKPRPSQRQSNQNPKKYQSKAKQEQNNQFYYKNSEGLQKYLKQIKQGKSGYQHPENYPEKNTKPITFQDLSNILNSPKYTEDEITQKQSPKFASTFNGPFLAQKKCAQQHIYENLQNDRSKNGLIKTNLNMLEQKYAITKPLSSYSPRTSKNYQSLEKNSSNYCKQGKQNKKQDSLLNKNYSTDFLSNNKKLLGENTQKYEYKRKLLQKCTSSPKFQTINTDHFNLKENEKNNSDKNHTKYMSTSSFFTGTNCHTSPKNNNNKEQISYLIKDFNYTKADNEKTNTKKTDLFMRTFDGTNNFLTQFSAKLKEQPSQIQKKTYWKGGSKNFNTDTGDKNQDKIQLDLRQNDKSTLSLLNTGRNTSCLYATSTQNTQAAKNKDRISFTKLDSPTSLLFQSFKLLNGELIIKDACELIHFTRLLHKLSFSTENNGNSIALLGYSVQILANLLEKCENFEIKYHYDSSTHNSAEIRESFKFNQIYLNNLSHVSEKQCYAIKKDISTQSRANLTSCNKTVQLKSIIQSYVKKFTQRKQALTKLLECNTLFENLTNKVKDAKSPSSSNYSGVQKPSLKKRVSLNSQKGYVNFAKLETVLEEMSIELDARKQNLSCNNKNNFSDIGQRPCSQSSNTQKLYIQVCQIYVQSICKSLRQHSFIGLIENIRMMVKNTTIVGQISSKNFSYETKNDKSVIEILFQELSSDKKRNNNQFSGKQTLIGRNMSMLVTGGTNFR